MYKLQIFTNGNEQTTSIVRQNADGSVTGFIQDPANTDYQAYLAWLAEGNTPLPAEENV
jgi:hypothetical protein